MKKKAAAKKGQKKFKTAARTTKKKTAKKTASKQKKKTTAKKTAARTTAKARTAKKKTTAKTAARKPAKKKTATKPARKKTAPSAAPRVSRPVAPMRPPEPTGIPSKPAPLTPAESTPSAPAMPAERPLGVVTHYYSHLGVAVVQLNEDRLRVGETIRIKGHTTDLTQPIESIEIDHQSVEEASAGQVFGLKVRDHVREHDQIFKASDRS